MIRGILGNNTPDLSSSKLVSWCTLMLNMGISSSKSNLIYVSDHVIKSPIPGVLSLWRQRTCFFPRKMVWYSIFIIYDMLSFIWQKFTHVSNNVIKCPFPGISGYSTPHFAPSNLVSWCIFLLYTIISFTKRKFNHLSYHVIKCPISGFLGVYPALLPRTQTSAPTFLY